jgi:hypothetical protein
MENQSVKVSLSAQTAIEKISIASASILYLVAFYRTLPHGDALRIVRQIEQSHLVWNPNHLLFDPLGHSIYALMSWSGLEITTLGSFSVISGTATVISLLIFHSILLRAGIELPSVRILGTAGVWASQSFLSQSTSQYYMMVQMPFLLGALYFYIDYVSCAGSGQVDRRNFIGSVAPRYFRNHHVQQPASHPCGRHCGWAARNPERWQIGLSLRLWGAAAALGVPVFIAGYLLSGKESGFFVWLLSYGGISKVKQSLWDQVDILRSHRGHCDGRIQHGTGKHPLNGRSRHVDQGVCVWILHGIHTELRIHRTQPAACPRGHHSMCWYRLLRDPERSARTHAFSRVMDRRISFLQYSMERRR